MSWIKAIPIKVPASFSVAIDNLILKYVWKGKTLLIKKNKVEGLTYLNFKTYSKATFKTMWYWHRSMEQSRKARLDPKKYSQLIFYNGAKIIQWRKECFQQMVLEQFDMQQNQHIQILTQCLSSKISSSNVPKSGRETPPSNQLLGWKNRSHLWLTFSLAVPEFSHLLNYVESHIQPSPPLLLPPT